MSYADESTNLDYLYSTINDRPKVSLSRVLGLGGIGNSNLGAGVEQFTPSGLIDAIVERVLKININLKFVSFRIESLFPDIVEVLIRQKLKSEIDNYIKDKMDLTKPEKITVIIDKILDGLEKDVRDYSSAQIGSEYVTMIDNFWTNILSELGGEGGFMDDLENAGSMFLNQWSIIGDKAIAPMSFVYALFTKSSGGPLRNPLLSVINVMIGSPIPGWLINDTVGAIKGKIKEELIKVMNSVAEKFGIEGPSGPTGDGSLMNDLLPAWINEYVNKTSITLPVEIWWKRNSGRVQSDLMMFLKKYTMEIEVNWRIAESQMPKIANLFSTKAAGMILTLYRINPQLAVSLTRTMTAVGLRTTTRSKASALNILPIVAIAGLAALYFLRK
uniref:Uncharacterized protein n=1 Tax=viral metagenome TaxID=1070528 RepID=A0A6M3XQ99_9ZZZZ